MAKVMMFTPTWAKPDGTTAIRPETRAAVKAQTFAGELVWEIGLHNPFPTRTHANVVAQYQRGRDIFLESDCDALLTVEHDMVPPADAAQKLWDTAADVVYGVYMLRHGTAVLNAWEYIGDHALGESLTLYPEKIAFARKQGAVRVCGVGWGCTLIRRQVLERIAIHDEAGGAGDVPFAHDALYAGFRSMARFDVPCDHYDGELRLRPFDEGAMGDRVWVLATQDVVVFDGRGSQALRAGQKYQLRRTLTSDLIRAGYVEECQPEGEEGGYLGRYGDETRNYTREAENAALEPSERAVMAKPRRKRKGL
jgi:hypothetical protein